MLIGLSGPSGIGKGYIKRRLLELNPELKELPWVTTRDPRTDEDQNSNRIHVTEARFDELESSGECVLIRRLYGHRYGLSREHIFAQAGVRLTEIHPDNVFDARSILPRLMLVGLVTSDYDLLRERMTQRGDGSSSISQRIESAKAEILSIQSQRHLFQMIVEISRERDVAETVVRHLQNMLSPKGGHHA